MQVSRSSWHYRLYNWYQNAWNGLGENGPKGVWDQIRNPAAYDHKPSSLCSYFWSIVFSLIALPLLTAVVAIVLGVVIAVAVPVLWLRDRKRDRRRRKLAALGLEEPEPRKPSLIAEFVKARKQKVCPLIELVD